MTVTEQGNKNTRWIWIGLGGAALFCLCAVAIALFTFYKIGQKVSDGVSADPEGASQAAHEIADYDLPPGYQEQMAMSIMFYSFVTIAPETYNTGEPIIMLAQFQTGINQQQMEQQMRQAMERQYNTRGADMKLAESKDATIRGEETVINVYEGSDQYGNTLRQLITSFPGKDGVAVLMVMGEASQWDKELIDEFIQSIR